MIKRIVIGEREVEDEFNATGGWGQIAIVEQSISV